MINLVTCALILVELALICEAASPVQLNGSNGQAILNQVAGSGQTLNTSTNASVDADLWNWGGIPIGYSLNNTGILFSDLDSGNWTPSI
jgi:hypothetical protein